MHLSVSPCLFQRSRLSIPRGILPSLMALALGAATMPSVQAADRIEERLPAEALKVLKKLQARNVGNVGVLQFRVQKDGQPASSNLPLGLIMATRLENALILMNDDMDKPLGIIRDAGRTAFQHKERATYRTAEGCAKLFGYKYPLAWGGHEVTADAFLTGMVQIHPREGTTTVVIEIIDRDKRKPEKFAEFSVKTDRTILTDVCTNFALDSRVMRTAGPEEQDEAARKDLERQSRQASAAPTANRLVELDVRYADAPQPITPRPDDAAAEMVPEPLEKQKVIFGLKNLGAKPVAVVLAVNGRNTLYKEDVRSNRADECTKWILEPGVHYEIRGFYAEDEKKVEPFAVQSEVDSDVEEDLNPNPKLGAIELFVFIEGTAGTEPPAGSGLRKLLPKSTEQSRPKTAKEASDLVLKNMDHKAQTAGFIKSSGNSEGADLKSREFKNPQLQESRIIWYKDRKRPLSNADRP